MDETWLATRLVAFIPLLLSLTVHEWAHAFAAFQLGDDTAKQLGRMTLDPTAHVDPVGTLLLPLLGVPFGWAKPVPVNPVRFRGVTMTTGMLITAVAGPLSNLALALLCAGLSRLVAPGGAVATLLATTTLLNVVLAFFNLLPVPPLDGSRIVDGVVSGSLRTLWESIGSFGGYLLAALFVVPPLLGIDLFAWPRAFAAALLP